MAKGIGGRQEIVVRVERIRGHAAECIDDLDRVALSVEGGGGRVAEGVYDGLG